MQALGLIEEMAPIGQAGQAVHIGYAEVFVAQRLNARILFHSRTAGFDQNGKVARTIADHQHHGQRDKAEIDRNRL